MILVYSRNANGGLAKDHSKLNSTPQTILIIKLTRSVSIDQQLQITKLSLQVSEQKLRCIDCKKISSEDFFSP